MIFWSNLRETCLKKNIYLLLQMSDMELESGVDSDNENFDFGHPQDHQVFISFNSNCQICIVLAQF